MSGSTGRSTKQHGKKVHPQIVLEKSIAENVSNFFYEVLPSQNAQTYEDKEQVLWMKFEQCDVNELSKYRKTASWEGDVEPLLLIIGYAHGVQGWLLPHCGIAEEVFSWRQGVVKALKVLPTPVTSRKLVDKFSLKRPLVAMVEESSGQTSNHVSFFSLRLNDQVDLIKFSSAVQNIQANTNIVVISFADKITVLHAGTLEIMFTVVHCYPNPEVNPIAVGDRWLAYSDCQLHPVYQSVGGCTGEQGTYKSSVLDMVKNVKTALSDFSYGKDKNNRRQKTPARRPGIVTIVATHHVQDAEVSLDKGWFVGVLAHFEAHHNPISHMQFNTSGLLLATADTTGRSFNVFSVEVDPSSVADTRIHHQYILHRGDTEATILDMCFSLDSRWIAVSSQRGTTHVYPINPYGGNVCWRTHKTPYVLNKLTGFERTTGSRMSSTTGRDSPRMSTSPALSRSPYDHGGSHKLSPPLTLYPHAQLKQCLRTVLESLGQSSYASTFGGKSPANVPDETVKIATTFGTMRGSPSPEVFRTSRHTTCLYVSACHGNLTEYVLEPHVDPKFPKGKDDTEAPVELGVHASYQWSLLRDKSSADLVAPLPPESPLLSLCSRGRSTVSPARSVEEDGEDSWIAQVEIHTHIGPHRRIWMGPQFRFVDFAENRSDAKTLGRSSPMDVPIGASRRQVVIEAHSYSGNTELSPFSGEFCSRFGDANEHEAALSRIKNQLAEAIQDETGDMSDQLSLHSNTEPFDTADLMDISCQPPGPNLSGRPTPTAPRPIKQEDQFQSITPKLASVAIARSSPACPELQPFWGKRTPSLEECRGLTSSAEELCSTLRDAHIHDPDSRASPWKPIEPPADRSSGEPSRMEKPLAISGTDITNSETFDSISLSDTASKEPPASTWSEDPAPFASSHSSPMMQESFSTGSKSKSLKIPHTTKGKSSLGSGTTSEDDLVPVKLVRTGTKNKSNGSSLTASEEDLARVSSKKASKGSRSQLTSAEDDWSQSKKERPSKQKPAFASGTTSEDDWAPVIDSSKKDTKKASKGSRSEAAWATEDWSQSKKERSSNLKPAFASGTTSEDDWAPVRDTAKKDRKKKKKKNNKQETSPVILAPNENVWNQRVITQEPTTTVSLEDEEDEDGDENGNQDANCLDNDLEKALGQVSSDAEEVVPRKPRGHHEMFPFVDTSSGEEPQTATWCSARDDDETTSGDDRKATSESDVTASPRVSGACSSKKTKKRRKNK